INKQKVDVEIGEYVEINRESNLDITLVQGISRGQRMDYTLQKAVELGVRQIVPVMTEHGNVQLDKERLEKRRKHWRKIIINSCEQCGRDSVPILYDVQDLSDWIKQDKSELKFILHPDAGIRMSGVEKQGNTLTLLAGPEGGFNVQELEYAQYCGFTAIHLGPRILRTETAALVAITACQVLWGDIF
ncbi:MAG: 16S rRNA (uracil(1498)-N(3))-methyltransferase, partial [Gammaproteobacteria bacterium]